MNNMLTEELIDYAKCLVDKEQIAFVSIVGSHNYGTANEDSDIDIKVLYYPAFREFYKNDYNRGCCAGPDVKIDYSIHPLHEYIKHSLKGNMSFFEVFLTENRWAADDRMIGLANLMRSAVKINYLKNYHSILGMANNKNENVLIETNSGDIVRAKKNAQHAIRLLSTLLNYKEKNDLELILPEKYMNLYLEIRNNDFDINTYDPMYYELRAKVEELESYFRSMLSMYMQPLLNYVDIINREVYTMIRDCIIKRGF